MDRKTFLKASLAVVAASVAGASFPAVAEEALGRPCRVEVLETVRRGGTTCHFAVRPA